MWTPRLPWSEQERADCLALDWETFRAKYGDARSYDGYRVKRQNMRRDAPLGGQAGGLPPDAPPDGGDASASEDTPTPDPIAVARQRAYEQTSARQAAQATKEAAYVAELRACIATSARALPLVAPVQQPFFINQLDYDRQRETLLIYSDTHAGAYVDGRDMGGLGGYSEAIWHERHDRLRLAVEETQRTHRTARLNIAAAGDMTEHELMHESQAHQIDLHITDQIARGAQRLALDVAAYAQIFEEVHLYFSPGNHGRASPRKGQLPWMVNFDLLIAWMASEFTKAYGNVVWHLPTAWFHVFQRGETVFVMVHGDDIKGWLGIPFYGMARARGRYQQMLGLAFDYLIVGHHHQPFKDDYIIANGSMVGATEYTAKQLVAANLPSQKLLLLDLTTAPGVTWVRDVALAEWSEIRRVAVDAA